MVSIQGDIFVWYITKWINKKQHFLLVSICLLNKIHTINKTYPTLLIYLILLKELFYSLRQFLHYLFNKMDHGDFENASGDENQPLLNSILDSNSGEPLVCFNERWIFKPRRHKNFYLITVRKITLHTSVVMERRDQTILPCPHIQLKTLHQTASAQVPSTSIMKTLKVQWFHL